MKFGLLAGLSIFYLVKSFIAHSDSPESDKFWLASQVFFAAAILAIAN